MIKNSSKEGDLILDLFAGSGSICLACKKLNRNWMGIELEKKWVNLARKNINSQ